MAVLTATNPGERSQDQVKSCEVGTHLDVVALMIVTTLPEQAMGDNFVDVELVKYRIRVLNENVVRN